MRRGSDGWGVGYRVYLDLISCVMNRSISITEIRVNTARYNVDTCSGLVCPQADSLRSPLRCSGMRGETAKPLEHRANKYQRALGLEI